MQVKNVKKEHFVLQKRACDYIPSSPLLFAAAQCLGYRNEHGDATPEMCMPSEATILKQIKRIVNKVSVILRQVSVCSRGRRKDF